MIAEKTVSPERWQRATTIAFARWAVPSSMAGLPISMAPLMLVFVAKTTMGTFVYGSIVVGVFVVGELLGASTVGVVNKIATVRGRLAWGYLVGAFAFAGIAFAPFVPFWMLLSLAFVAGFAPASSPGTLQAALLDSTAEEMVPRILVAARVQSTIVFMAGPALVGALSLATVDWVAPAICATAMLLALVGLVAIPNAEVASAREFSAASTLRIVWSVWPIYAVGLAATFVVGLVELVIPPLLEQRGIPAGWVGLIASSFFGFGMLGSIVYGSKKRWRGSYSSQSFIITIIMFAGLCLVALVANLVAIVVGVLIAGSGVAILLMIRTLSLREVLPKAMHAAAFSLNYAMSCLSYILCALIGGTSLANGSPSGALLIGAASILVVGTLASVFERSLVRRKVKGDESIPVA